MFTFGKYYATILFAYCDHQATYRFSAENQDENGIIRPLPQ